MRLLLLVLTGIVFALGGYRNAHAQSEGTHRDRPFQRWLPPPEGSQGSILDQLRLLEQLRGRMTTQPDPSSMPELTESQLQVLDQAYKAWTEQSGGSQLPDWNNIPKEWVDQALANPEELKQAQRLIQQYARQRKLTLPSSVPGLPQGLKIPGLKTPEISKPESSAQQRLGADRTDARNGDARNGDARNGDARNGDARNGDARNGDALSADAQGDRATSSGAPALRGPGSASPSELAQRSSTRQSAGSANAQPPRMKSRNTESSRSESPNGDRQGDNVAETDLKRDGSSSSTGAIDSAEAVRQPGASGSANAGSASDAASKPSGKRPEGLSDAAQLKALRELLEKVKAVQAARDAAGTAGNGQASDRGMANRTDAQSTDASRNSSNNNLGRNARGSANGFKEPISGAAGAPLSARSMVHPPLANSQRRGAGGNMPNSQGARDPNGSSPNAQSNELSDDLRDGESDGSAVSSSEARDSAESSPFDMPPMFEAMAGASSGSARTDGDPLSSSALGAGALSSGALSSDALRSAARGLAIERSSAQDAGAQRSSSLGSSGMRPTNSASGTIRFPELSDELSSALASADSQAELRAKLQRDVQQLGWHGALRRIIHDTFKEETKTARPSQATRRDESTLSIKLPQTKPRPPRILNSSASAIRKNMPNLLSDSRVAGALKDVWKAIANAPLSNSSGLAKAPSALPASEASSQKSKWNGKWNLQGNNVQIVLALVAVVALVIWVSRKRPALFRSERTIDPRWAKEVLAEGIRTRADVIRAFHRLVSQTTQPVASWWTHRYVTRRLTEATPQLAAAMADLSSVYEQARYMPPEAELSPEQISRVCGALRECVTYGNSAANASS